MTKRHLLRECAGWAGALLVTFGAYETHPALGYGVAGLFLMAAAMLSARSSRGSR